MAKIMKLCFITRLKIRHGLKGQTLHIVGTSLNMFNINNKKINIFKMLNQQISVLNKRGNFVGLCDINFKVFVSIHP